MESENVRGICKAIGRNIGDCGSVITLKGMPSLRCGTLYIKIPVGSHSMLIQCAIDFSICVGYDLDSAFVGEVPKLLLYRLLKRANKGGQYCTRPKFDKPTQSLDAHSFR